MQIHSVMSLLSDARAVVVRPDPPDREPIASDAVESSDLSAFHGKRRSPTYLTLLFAATKRRCTSFELLRPSVSLSVKSGPTHLRANKPSADELNLIVTL